MVHEFEGYTTPPPLRYEPDFLRDTRQLGEEFGGPAHGVREMFRRANIHVEPQGDNAAWGEEGKGALFIGDHRNGLEYAPLLAMFGGIEREDLHFVAKPFCMQARVLGTIGIRGSGLTLPVIPGTLARDRVNIIPFRFDTFSKPRLIGALMLASMGKIPPPYTIRCRFGMCGTVNEIVPTASHGQDADSITETLRLQFETAFANLEKQK